MKASSKSAPTSHLNQPWFDPLHAELGERLRTWAEAQHIDETDDRAACRAWVSSLGAGGWLRYCVPEAFGGALPALDSRCLVVLRETLAYYSPLADFAFAMQGLGSGCITLSNNSALQARYLPKVATGEWIAAFALSETDAGSDVAAMQTIATKSMDTVTPGLNGVKNAIFGSAWTLNGSKTWISNGGMADFYTVFAKTEPTAGARGITAFVVDAQSPGLDDSEHIHVMAPHPLATLNFNSCAVDDAQRLSDENQGFKLAMRTLDIFRASVAAAALGMGRRALAQATSYAQTRRMFGGTLADQQLTQAKLGEMAALLEAGAQLTYRAAWLRDKASTDLGALAAYPAAAAMAKLVATENASRVVDMAVQMHGGRGVQVGQVVEHLYRDIRSLRIYEGASEVQQLIIGKAVLKGAA